MKTLDEILTIADFLGDDISSEQTERLMGEARELSISDRELLLGALDGGEFYTAMSEHNAEMGGLYRY